MLTDPRSHLGGSTTRCRNPWAEPSGFRTSRVRKGEDHADGVGRAFAVVAIGLPPSPAQGATFPSRADTIPSRHLPRHSRARYAASHGFFRLGPKRPEGPSSGLRALFPVPGRCRTPHQKRRHRAGRQPGKRVLWTDHLRGAGGGGERDRGRASRLSGDRGRQRNRSHTLRRLPAGPPRICPESDGLLCRHPRIGDQDELGAALTGFVRGAGSRTMATPLATPTRQG